MIQNTLNSRGPDTLVNMYISQLILGYFLFLLAKNQAQDMLLFHYDASNYPPFCPVRSGCIWSYLKQTHLVVNLKIQFVSDPKPSFLTYKDPEDVEGY